VFDLFKQIYKSSGECIYHLSDEDTKSDRLPVTSLNFIPPELSSRGELLIATCELLWQQ